MTTAIVLLTYFSGIEVAVDWMAMLAVAGDFLTTVAAVLIVLV